MSVGSFEFDIFENEKEVRAVASNLFQSTASLAMVEDCSAVGT